VKSDLQSYPHLFREGHSIKSSVELAVYLCDLKCISTQFTDVTQCIATVYLHSSPVEVLVIDVYAGVHDEDVHSGAIVTVAIRVPALRRIIRRARTRTNKK
jgi:hypothetical protein